MSCNIFCVFKKIKEKKKTKCSINSLSRQQDLMLEKRTISFLKRCMAILVCNPPVNTFIININNNNKYFKQLKISTCTYQQYYHLHIWQNVLIILEVFEDLVSTFDHGWYKQKDSTQLLEFED